LGIALRFIAIVRRVVAGAFVLAFLLFLVIVAAMNLQVECTRLIVMFIGTMR
jgi:hypothetical protein